MPRHVYFPSDLSFSAGPWTKGNGTVAIFCETIFKKPKWNKQWEEFDRQITRMIPEYLHRIDEGVFEFYYNKVDIETVRKDLLAIGIRCRD